MRLILLLSFVGMCFSPIAVQAQEDDDSARSEVDVALQRRINLAISQGVEALFAEQEIDGSWRNHSDGYRNGQTALSVYTLLKCDVEASHPAIVRAVSFLRAKQPSRTYSAACQLLALCTLDPREHREWISEIADDLASWQRGAYGYPDGEVDLSNTQYAALGLRVAAQHGHKISPRTWERMAEWTLVQQQTTPGAAGFRYRDGSDATGSMTTAGLAVLAIAVEQLPRKNREYEKAIERGRRWLDENISIDRNPVVPFGSKQRSDQSGGHHLYYLYGLERAGAFLKTAVFGECDWYREGATHLVDRQHANGSWGGQADTSFALLFLARATSKVSYTGEGIESATKTYGDDDPYQDVSLRAAGDRPLKIWISSFGNRTYEDFEWEGEEGRGLRVVRVEYRLEDPGCEEGPVRGGRYPTRLEIERSGRYRIFARVMLWPQGVESMEEDLLYALESPTLEVEISRSDDPRLDEYARDAARNLLNVPRIKLTPSSKRDGTHGADRALDGRMGTMWISSPTDPHPKLLIELQVLEVFTGGREDQGVGFAEVELVSDRK